MGHASGDGPDVSLALNLGRRSMGGKHSPDLTTRLFHMAVGSLKSGVFFGSQNVSPANVPQPKPYLFMLWKGPPSPIKPSGLAGVVESI